MSAFVTGSISAPLRKDEEPPESELMETDAEDEVDQLESDTDAEALAAQKVPAALRPPGKTLLPANRLDNIIQADGVTGTLALSKEGQYILSVATEEFIKRMVEAGHMKAQSERRSTVTYHDMAYTTQQYQEFMFLEDTIPPPISLAEALQLRQEKEQEMLDDDPAMAGAPSANPYPSVTSTTQSAAPKAKSSKSKSSQANVHDNQNGQSASTKKERKAERSDKGGPRKESGPGKSKSSATNGLASTSASITSTSPTVNGRATSKSSTPAVAKDDMDVEEAPKAVSKPVSSGRSSQASSSKMQSS